MASAPDQTAERRDLARYVRWYDAALEPEFCERMIESFHQLGRFHDRSGRGTIATLTDSAWTELNVTRLADPGFKSFFMQNMQRYLALYNEQIGLTIPIPPSARIEDLRIKRYLVQSQDQFQPHFDALHESANRYLVFLWYLNDVAEGGETTFVDLGISVQARAGRLLMFPPYWLFQHAGLAPRSNDKYMISTYLLF